MTLMGVTPRSWRPTLTAYKAKHETSALKKGRNVFVSTLFSFGSSPHRGAPSSIRAVASALPRRLGFVDRFLMIPAAAADGLIDRQRPLLIGGFGFAVTSAAERRAAPGRELVDLGGSVIQACVHRNSP